MRYLCEIRDGLFSPKNLQKKIKSISMEETTTPTTTINEIKNIINNNAKDHNGRYHATISSQQQLDNVAKKGLEWLLKHIKDNSFSFGHTVDSTIVEGRFSSRAFDDVRGYGCCFSIKEVFDRMQVLYLHTIHLYKWII